MYALLEKHAALKDDVELQPHQQDALEHARGKPGTIVNHGLGSGKTVTSLGIAEDKGGNTLAVTPASLEDNFRDEIDSFIPEEGRDRYKVTSYSRFQKDPDKYIDEHQPSTVIADEFHRVRNPGTNAHQALKKVRDRVPQMVGLTGTLLNNEPTEAVHLTNLAAGEDVISPQQFGRKHIKEVEEKPDLWGRIKGVEPGVRPEIDNAEELRDTFGPYIHRFTGSEEYEQHIPEVEEEEVPVEMSKKQQNLIRDLEKKYPSAASRVKHNLPPAKQDTSDLNAFMVGARQVANTPATHDTTVDDPVEASPKLQKMIGDIEEARQEDDNFRGVQFSNFLDAGVRPTQSALQDRDVDARLYEGSMSKKDRKDTVQAYNQGEADVLGLSPAGSEGLDLKGTKMLQTTEPDWNPEVLNQAIGRAARYKSHEHLPEDERKVRVRRYRSTNPKKWYQKLLGKDSTPSVDDYISQRAKEKERLNQTFYDALEGSS